MGGADYNAAEPAVPECSAAESAKEVANGSPAQSLQPPPGPEWKERKGRVLLVLIFVHLLFGGFQKIAPAAT